MIEERATSTENDKYIEDPRIALVEAVSENREMGSSTCVLASLNKYEPRVNTANLGDSGYILLRKNGMDLLSIFRSTEQTHGFNFPYQCGTGGDDPMKADVL